MGGAEIIRMVDAATIEAICWNVYGTAIGQIEDYDRTGFYMDEDCTGIRAEALRRNREGIVYVSHR